MRAHWVSALTPGLCVQRNVTDSNPGIYPTLLSLQFQVSVPYRGYFLLPVKVFENMYDILDINSNLKKERGFIKESLMRKCLCLNTSGTRWVRRFIFRVK